MGRQTHKPWTKIVSRRNIGGREQLPPRPLGKPSKFLERGSDEGGWGRRRSINQGDKPAFETVLQVLELEPAGEERTDSML